MPAHHCDIDHAIDYATGGKTDLTNLGALCRNHHLLKHHGGWHVTQDRNGEYAFVSPTGRRYTTQPPGRVRFVPAHDPPGSPPGQPRGLLPGAVEYDDGHADLNEHDATAAEPESTEPTSAEHSSLDEPELPHPF